MSNSNETIFDAATWKEINDAVVTEVMKIRTAQKVIPTAMLDGNPDSISDETLNVGPILNIPEGATKSFLEIFLEFSLTSAQVNNEAQQHFCKTIAVKAAMQLALLEDTALFQGGLALPAISAINGRSMPGLLHEIGILNIPVPVAPPAKGIPGPLWGENTYSAVANGIAQLSGLGQGPKYALFLHTNVFADTHIPQNGFITADRIKPHVEGGVFSTSTLPANTGLLLSLGGNSLKIHIGKEANVEFDRKQGGIYFFRVAERIQYTVLDVHSIVALNFA